MKIYIIKANEDEHSTGYDCYFAHVIAARSPRDVRLTAYAVAADEDANLWLSTDRSTVTQLASECMVTTDNKPLILMSDFLGS